MSILDLHRNERGFAGVEFAFTASVLALLFVVAIDLGTGFFRRLQVQSAAQRGALYATIRGFDTGGISSTITSAAGNPAALPAPRKFCGCPTASGVMEVMCSSTCTISGSIVNAGVYVAAGAQATYSPVLKYSGLPGTMTFQATQVVRIQ